MTMHREIELKLELAPKDADRLRAVPPLALTPASQQHQRSAYFDTPRRKLRKAGFTLRVRRSGGRMIQTVKASGNGAGLFERDEWEAPVRAMKPDLDAARCTPLADLLTSKTEDRLQLVATIEVDRTSWKITDADDLIEVTFDAGVVSAGEAHQPISELELELKQGSEKALFGLCERIGGQVPLRLGVLTKAERAVTVGDGKHD